MVSIEKVTKVFYHGNCADGHTAAYVVWIQNKTAEYVPVQYGFVPPNCTGEVVLILDFSFDMKTTQRLIQETQGNILILDHHKTAKGALEKVPDANKVLDLTRSGARIAWDWVLSQLGPICPIESELPRFIDYIEDRDLWNKKSTLDWRTFDAGYWTEPLSFERIEDIRNGKITLQSILDINAGLSKFSFTVVKDPLSGDMIVLATGNVTNLTSDVADAVLNKYPFVDVYAGYYIDVINQETQFSFRSRAVQVAPEVYEGYHTNFLCEYFVKHNPNVKNGGGHPASSGVRFKQIIGELPLEVISRKKIGKLARGMSVKIWDKDPEAAFLQERFPETATLVPLSSTLLFNGEVIREGPILPGYIVVIMKGEYGRAVTADKEYPDFESYLKEN
jgi:oligoribonuclease NrnB/cAMP/cGMP phosphodiesterase (DHH superfamily)